MYEAGDFSGIRKPETISLCRKDLPELRSRLSMMSITAVEDFYQHTPRPVG
jgi:hypothetical protein